MDGRENNLDPRDAASDALTCQDCRHGLQDYLDGTLEKKASLRIFMHLRGCEPCSAHHDELVKLFGLLDDLPEVPAPDDFDVAVLAAVPYESYRAMAELRRERVPVFLEEHFLPAFLRARVTRLAGVGVSAVATGTWLFIDPAPLLAAAAIAGLAPEIAVRLQGLGRRMIGLGRVEG
jgi:anti-sigma factor RsiW